MAIRKYKTLTFAEKISCLIIDEELKAIEAGYRDMQTMPDNQDQMSQPEIEKYQQSRIQRELFNKTLKRVLNVLKYNYMPDFNRLQIQQLNNMHTKLQPCLGFNSLDRARGSLPDKP